jgi:hypothetical protein
MVKVVKSIYSAARKRYITCMAEPSKISEIPDEPRGVLEDKDLPPRKVKKEISKEAGYGQETQVRHL